MVVKLDAVESTLPARGAKRMGGECPLCRAQEFQDFRERQYEYRRGCRAKARTRLTYLFLDRLGVIREGMKALHFAPEPGLRRKLFEIFGRNYVVADYDPEKLSGFEAGAKENVDLCDPPAHLTVGSLILLLHSHVLEHLPCNWALAFLDIHAALKPTGVHVFYLNERAMKWRRHRPSNVRRQKNGDVWAPEPFSQVRQK